MDLIKQIIYCIDQILEIQQYCKIKLQKHIRNQMKSKNQQEANVSQIQIEFSTDKFTKQYEQIQYNALKYSQLKIPQQIATFDISIQQNQWIHQIRCGFHNKKDIVLLHGYGGTSMTFVRLFKQLSKYYRVHALDHLGIGLSSRKVFQPEWNTEQSILYFVNSIESWRNSMKIKKFILVGHSFGGYLAASYAEKYPDKIQRLILLSPAGTKFMDKQKSQQQLERIKENATCGRKFFLTIVKPLSKCIPTPSSSINIPLIGNSILNFVLEKRLKLENEQKQAWKIYLKKISLIEPNSQKAFFKIFHMPGAGTELPIQKKLMDNKFEFNCQFYFGDTDWMEKQTAYKLINTQTKCPNKVNVVIIQNCGHQIMFDNPTKVLTYIINS